MDSHKNELKKLKKIYGLSRQDSDIKLAQGYTDRAQKRREDIGSHNPHEKTQVASVDEYDLFYIIANVLSNIFK